MGGYGNEEKEDFLGKVSKELETFDNPNPFSQYDNPTPTVYHDPSKVFHLIRLDESLASALKNSPYGLSPDFCRGEYNEIAPLSPACVRRSVKSVKSGRTKKLYHKLFSFLKYLTANLMKSV